MFILFEVADDYYAVETPLFVSSSLSKLEDKKRELEKIRDENNQAYETWRKRYFAWNERQRVENPTYLETTTYKQFPELKPNHGNKTYLIKTIEELA